MSEIGIPDAISNALRNSVRLVQNRKLPHVYDLELGNLPELRKFESVECHVVVYPYSREISSRDITFSPYEEYVTDVLSNNRSAYVKTGTILDKCFGVLLGLTVVLVHLLLNRDKDPMELFTVEPLIAIFGAYVIGKELWSDLDRFLINLTKHWRLRYVADYYNYLLERGTTLANYSGLAKRHRYGRASMLPETMEFIPQSNSQTVRMRFSRETVSAVKDDTAQILAIHVEEDLNDAFLSRGFMLGIKLTVNTKSCGGRKAYEIFQSVSNGEIGCLDHEGTWFDGQAYCRHCRIWGRLKYFARTGLLPKINLLLMNLR